MAMLVLPLLFSMASTEGLPAPRCDEGFVVTKTVTRLSGLPPEIAQDLNVRIADIVDSDGNLQKTDSPETSRPDGPFHRFAFAILVRDEWFVTFEQGGLYNIVTWGYVRAGGSPNYQLWPTHFFNGPPCKVIRAALDGVESRSF